MSHVLTALFPIHMCTYNKKVIDSPFQLNVPIAIWQSKNKLKACRRPGLFAIGQSLSVELHALLKKFKLLLVRSFRFQSIAITSSRSITSTDTRYDL